DPPGRGDRGEGIPVRPVRPVARLSPLLTGRLSGNGRGLRAPLRAADRAARNAARSLGVGADPGRPLGPGRLAVRAGPGRPAERLRASVDAPDLLDAGERPV